MTKFLVALILFATSALAADFTGKWTGEGVTNGDAHSLYFVIQQDGASVTGSGGPDANEQHNFASAKMNGAKLVLDIAVGEKGTLHFELETDGGASLKGTVLFRREDGNESGTVTLKKVV